MVAVLYPVFAGISLLAECTRVRLTHRAHWAQYWSLHKHQKTLSSFARQDNIKFYRSSFHPIFRMAIFKSQWATGYSVHLISLSQAGQNTKSYRVFFRYNLWKENSISNFQFPSCIGIELQKRDTFWINICQKVFSETLASDSFNMCAILFNIEQKIQNIRRQKMAIKRLYCRISRTVPNVNLHLLWTIVVDII